MSPTGPSRRRRDAGAGCERGGAGNGCKGAHSSGRRKKAQCLMNNLPAIPASDGGLPSVWRGMSCWGKLTGPEAHGWRRPHHPGASGFTPTRILEMPTRASCDTSDGVKMPLSPMTMRSFGTTGARDVRWWPGWSRSCAGCGVDADELGRQGQCAIQLSVFMHLDDGIHAKGMGWRRAGPGPRHHRRRP